MFLVMAGCGSIRPQTDPAQDKKAAEKAFQIRALNQDIFSSKGTGWLTLDMDGRKDTFRIAWAAQAPNRARITLLASGIPVETIVADGKSVHFLSHTQAHKPHTAMDSDPDLNPVVHIRIRLSEIVSILLGRLPLGPFEDAWFSPGNQDDIILRQKGASSIHVLNLDPEGIPLSLARRDGSGKLVYEIRFLSLARIQEKNIPNTLFIRDRRSRSIRLSVSQFIPNPPIKESVFILTEQGS